MAKQIFSNDASSLLAASINASDLTIQVASGEGARFPSPGAGEFFIVTLENSSGDREVVKIESRSTDLLTVASGGRGQEGSSAASWTNGQTRVELRLTKGTTDRFLQREGDAMSGDLDMDGNDVIDPVISGAGAKMTAGEIVDVPLRGVTGVSSNEVRVPTDGTRATAGGAAILVATDEDEIRAAAYEVGMVMLWYGAAVSCPTGWKICDGASGTPDMRDRVAIGAGTSYSLNATGGAASSTPTTGSSGAHDHGGATDGHALTEAEMPSHTHQQLFDDSTGAAGGSGNPDANGGATPLGTTGATGGNTAHTHPISSDGAHTHTVAVSTLPPYRALHFIMYTG